MFTCQNIALNLWEQHWNNLPPDNHKGIYEHLLIKTAALYNISTSCNRSVWFFLKSTNANCVIILKNPYSTAILKTFIDWLNCYCWAGMLSGAPGNGVINNSSRLYPWSPNKTNLSSPKTAFCSVFNIVICQFNASEVKLPSNNSYIWHRK